MAEEDVQKYGLDATDYFEAVEAIVRKNRSMAESLVKLGEKIVNADKIQNQFATNFRKVSKAPEGFAAALKLLGGEYDETKDKITLTDAALQKHLEMIQSVARAYDTDLMRSVEQFVSGEKKKQDAVENSSRKILEANRAYEAQMARLRNVADARENGPQASRAGKKVVRRRTSDEIEIAGSGPLPLEPGERVLTGKKDFSAAAKVRRDSTKELTQQVNELGAALDKVAAKYEKLGPAASEGKANELQTARSLIEEEKRRNATLVEQEALLRRLKVQADIRADVERRGRSVTASADPFAMRKIRGLGSEASSVAPDGESAYKVQTKAETKAVGDGIKQRQKLREQEVKDLEKSMNAQVKAFEQAEKDKVEAAAKAKKKREELAKEEALKAAESFRRQAESQIRVPTGKDPRQGVKAADAAGGIADLIQRQKITADRANQIIAQISGGQNAVLSGVDARVGKMARAMKSAQDQLNNFNVDGPKGKMDELNASFVEAEEKSKQASKGILLSWQSMARLFVIQALHTVVRAFINEIQNAVDTAAQWQIKISEIRTITQDQPLAFDEWARSIRRLSDEFGNPIMDVTAGLYETISNQVGKGATAVNFMTRALEFSKVTGATTADSVNLLSGVLNSFSMSAVQTERVAGVLFKTIDKGRVRADEIANTFGRVGPSAKTLGLSIEEVGAALATLTIRGVPPAEAMTLLNNVMNGLVKPSNEMKEFLGEIGVASGEQAVAVNGFAGTLALLEQRSKGAAGELGQLFTNIRGQRGITIFSGDGLRNFQENLQAMKDGVRDFQKAIPIAMESPGAQLVKQLNQVQNIVVADIGQPILKAALDVANAFGGLANIFKFVISAGTPLLKFFVIYKTYTYAAMVATAAKTVVDKAQAVASLANAQIGMARADSAIAQGRAEAYAMQAEALRTRGLIAESAAMMQAAYSQDLLAAGSLKAAAAMRTQTAAGVLMRGAFSGLLGIITNPAFLLTGLIAALIYTVQKEKELRAELVENYKKASDAATEYYQKITITVEKELAKQSEAFERQLNKQFSAYVDFATKIEDQIEKLYDTQKELSGRAAEESKDAMRRYAKVYSEQLSIIESEHKKTLDNIRKAEEDLDRSKQDFAERQFRRNLKLAEHADRMRNPNAKGNPVQANQIQLVNAEINRLNLENQKLAKPTGKASTDADNRTRMMENVRKIDDLLTTQADKRFSIEEERQRLVAQIAEIEKKTVAEAAERRIEDEKTRVKAAADAEKIRHREAKEDIPRGKAGRAASRFDANVAARDGEREDHEAATDALDAKADAARTAQTAAQRAEQDRQNAAKLAELKTTLANYDASLKALPSIVQIQQQGQQVEAATNALLQQRLVLLQQIEKQQQGQIDRQKAAFDNLQTSLERLEKFKLDPKIDLKKQGDLDAQLKKFDTLVSEARTAGVNDQQLMLQFVRQRIALENEGRTKIAQNEQKARAAELQAYRKELESRNQQAKTELSELQKRVAAIGTQIFGTIGGPNAEGGFQPGTFQAEALYQMYDSAGTTGVKKFLGGPGKMEPGRFVEFKGDIEALRVLMLEVIQMQANAAQGKGTVDQKKVDQLLSQWQTLNTKIGSKVYNVSSGGEARWATPVPTKMSDYELSGPRKNAAGQDIGPLTIGEVLKNTDDQVKQLIAAVNKTKQNVAEQDSQTKALARTQQALAALEASYGRLDLATQAQAKSFQQLTEDVYKVVAAMQGLKTTLDRISTAPLAPGAPLPKFAFGGANMGTDTMVAAVSPGEFVMNARSTRKFYGQLMAMNRYADGGMINFNPNFSRPIAEVPMGGASDSSISVSVGQIVVQGNGSPDYDARQLGRALEKEIRRGTINLRAHDEG